MLIAGRARRAFKDVGGGCRRLAVFTDVTPEPRSADWARGALGGNAGPRRADRRAQRPVAFIVIEARDGRGASEADGGAHPGESERARPRSRA